MPAKDSKTILVRVPAEIVDAAKKVKIKENLPTIGNAIRYWFEQQKDEEIQLQLADIKVKLEEIVKFQKTVNQRTFALVYDKVMDDLKKVARVVGLSPQEMQDYFDLREEEIIKLVYAYPATKNYCSLLSELKQEMLSSEK